MSWWRRLLGADEPPADPASTAGESPLVDAGFGVPAEWLHPELPAHVAEIAARHRVVLLTREGCLLCVDADLVVGQVVAPAQYARVSIDDDPETRDRFATDIPVVIVDGRILARWRVSADELTQALEEQQ